jgi:hypothetical protein
MRNRTDEEFGKLHLRVAKAWLWGRQLQDLTPEIIPAAS